MKADWIGWVAPFILVLTIAKQLYKQWKEGTSEGVSKWAFARRSNRRVSSTED